MLFVIRASSSIVCCYYTFILMDSLFTNIFYINVVNFGGND